MLELHFFIGTVFTEFFYPVFGVSQLRCVNFRTFFFFCSLHNVQISNQWNSSVHKNEND